LSSAEITDNFSLYSKAAALLEMFSYMPCKQMQLYIKDSNTIR